MLREWKIIDGPDGYPCDYCYERGLICQHISAETARRKYGNIMIGTPRNYFTGEDQICIGTDTGTELTVGIRGEEQRLKIQSDINRWHYEMRRNRETTWQRTISVVYNWKENSLNYFKRMVGRV